MRSFSAPASPVLGGLVATAMAGVTTASPDVPGLHGSHPLNAVGRGRVLIEELRCAACHDGMGEVPPGPDLAAAGARLNPGFLASFIESPSGHDPGTTMPHLLDGFGEAERAEVAASLSAYLLSRPREEPGPPAEADPEEGGRLFHEVGCVACHSPRSGDGAEKVLPGDVGLDHVARKYRPTGLAGFLHAPLRVRPAGRMPDLALQQAEADAIAAFLLKTADKPEAPAAPPSTPDRIEAGRKVFVELRCVACHDTGEASMPAMPATPPAGPALRLDHGCLSADPGAAPDYQLSDDQREAIRAALKSAAEPVPPAEQVDRRLTQLNCIACHERGDYGGVHPDRDAYFHSTQEALGDPARIPPPLTLTGAKLRKQWLDKVLYSDGRARPYMLARMPRFGDAALAGLPEAFAAADHLPPVEYPPLDRNSKPMMRNGAHLLLGNKGLNCIACHNFNGKEGPAMHGLDLMTTYQRLRPAWFDRFMRNPPKLRPGIIMPSFWPGGEAVQTEILDGDADEQLRALYYFFSLGRSARDPSGLKAKDSTLHVGDLARTYRGRSRVAGYRGIAVGYPGGMNYAFNAQTGTLSAIWQGDYVRVNWRGQGAGNFNPAERSLQLSRDVSLLAEARQPWPAAPVRDKQHPVNPDPTYPRQYAYAFEGYSIAADGVPTFRYRTGGVEVTDTATPVTAGDATVLRRTLTFETPKAETRYFRALTGPIERVSESAFEIPGLRLSLHELPAGAAVRVREAAADGREMLLELPLPTGRSQLILDYVLRH